MEAEERIAFLVWVPSLQWVCVAVWEYTCVASALLMTDVHHCYRCCCCCCWCCCDSHNRRQIAYYLSFLEIKETKSWEKKSRWKKQSIWLFVSKNGQNKTFASFRQSCPLFMLFVSPVGWYSVKHDASGVMHSVMHSVNCQCLRKSTPLFGICWKAQWLILYIIGVFVHVHLVCTFYFLR